MANYSGKKLEEEIEKIFEYLEKKGIYVTQDKKQEIIEKLCNELDDQLSADDLKDHNVQKKLVCSVTSMVMGKEEETDSIVKELKSDKKREPNPRTDDKLNLQMLLLTTLAAGLNQEERDKKLFPNEPPFPQALKKELSKLKDDNNKAIEINRSQEELLDKSLRSLYGYNPKYSGRIEMPQLATTVGDLVGLTNQSTPDPTSTSIMVEKITYSPGKEDPLGLENIARIIDQGDGVNLGPSNTPQLAPSNTPAK